MHSHFAVLSIGVLSPENQFRGHKNRACIHGTQALPPEKGRTKARVPICPISQNEIKAIFVSSALNAYQAIDILLLEVCKKQKAADKTDSSHGIYLAGGLSRMSGLTIRSGQSVGPGYGITKPVSSQPFRRLHYYSIVLLFTS